MQAQVRGDPRFRPYSATNLLCDSGQVTAPLWVSLHIDKMKPLVWLAASFQECIST